MEQEGGFLWAFFKKCGNIGGFCLVLQPNFKRCSNAENLRIFGIIFFLYPNDHEPIHAHAISGGNETIFELHFENGQLKEIKTRKKRGKEHLPKAKMEQAKAFVEEFAVQIAEKWYRFYILKETLTPEKINKKI